MRMKYPEHGYIYILLISEGGVLVKQVVNDYDGQILHYVCHQSEMSRHRKLVGSIVHNVKLVSIDAITVHVCRGCHVSLHIDSHTSCIESIKIIIGFTGGHPFHIKLLSSRIWLVNTSVVNLVNVGCVHQPYHW